MQEYFTLRDAADYLGLSEDQVFRMMQLGNPGPSLTPAYVVETTLEAIEIGGNGRRMKIGPGVFEIDVFPYQGSAGRVCVLKWDEHDMAYVNEFTCYEPFEQPEDEILSLYPYESDRRNRRDLCYGKPESIPKEMDAQEGPTLKGAEADENQCHDFILWQKGWRRVRRYVLADAHKIPVPRTAVVVLGESLLAYFEATGKKPPEALREKFSANAHVEDCRRRRMPDPLIALGLHEQNLGDEEIGYLLPRSAWGADPQKYPVTKEAVRKHGERLWKKGKRMRDKT